MSIDIKLNRDEFFMQKALELATEAAYSDEVPVGAVIVLGDKIIAEGKNKRESSNNALYHAEIEAINKACKVLKSWRLIDCELFVTLEPCPMCAGAIINSRIKRLIFGASDAKSGACGSKIDLFNYNFNHKPEITKGVLQNECSLKLKKFFEVIRNK